MKIDLLVNNVNTKIVGNLTKQVLTSLSESMKYKTSEYNGYTFVDVEHELFHKLTQSFPTGLYSKAADVLESNDIDFNTIDKRKNPLKIKSLPLHNVTPYDFQHQLINDAVENQRFVVQVATGGGKTVIGAGILAKLNLPSIFVVHTGDLFEQSYDELSKFLKVPIGKIGGGIYDIKQINVCMIQTIFAAIDQEYIPYDDVEKELMEKDDIVKKSFQKHKIIIDFLQTVQVVLIDECHHIRANSYINVMKTCKNAYYRGGLSATPHSGDGRDIILQAFAGSIIGRISASYLISRDLLVQPAIYYLNGNKIDKYIYSRKRYNSIYKKYIVENTFRNKKIVECVERFQELNKTVLITVTTKKHGQLLQEMIRKIGYECEFIFSSVDKMQRKVHIQNVRERKLKIIIGTSLDYNETIWIRNSKKIVDLVKIGDFVEKYLNGFDDNYETLSFSNDKIVWKKITHVHKHKCQNEVLRTRLKSGRLAQVTENHSLISYDNGKVKEVLPKINEKIITALQMPLQSKLIKEFNLLEEYTKCSFVDRLEVRLDNDQDFLQFNNSTMRFIRSEYIVLKRQCQNISRDTERNAVERLKNKDQFYKDFVIWFNENVKYYKRKYRCSLQSVLNFKHYKKLKAKIYYKRSNKGNFGLPFTLQNSIELGYICGMLIGDGHMSKGQFCLCFKGQRPDVKFTKEKSVDLMSKCLKTVFPDLKFNRGRNGTMGIKIAGKLMSYLVWEIFNLKGNALDKKVPQFIFNSSKDIQIAFLYGYFLTDGSFNNKYSFSFVSVSKTLLDGVIGILLNNNINNFSFKCRKANLDSEGSLLKSNRRIKSKNMGYQLTVRGNLFGLGIGPSLNRPGQSYSKCKINDEFANVPITKIEKMYTLDNRPENVYDISVQDTEVFFNGVGVLCHNSLADEGLNIPALDALILAGGGKSPTRLKQRIGRVLRLSPGKKEAFVVDFKDNVRYLLGHYKERRKMCESEEQFKIVENFT